MGEMVKTDGVVHDADDLLASWRQPFGKWYLSVYIWKDVEALYKLKLFPEDTYLACYIDIGKRTATTKRRGGQFGQLHFNINNIGAGIFAHELRHFDWGWFRWQGYHHYGKKRREDTCCLIGDLTANFWDTFYKCFKEKKAGDFIEYETVK